MARRPPSPSPGPGWVALNEAPTSDSSGEEDEIFTDDDSNLHRELKPTEPLRKRKESDQLESLPKRPKHEQHQKLGGSLGGTSASAMTRPNISSSFASSSAAGSSRMSNAAVASSNSISAAPRPSLSMLPPSIPARSNSAVASSNSISAVPRPSSSMLPPPIPARSSLNSTKRKLSLSQPTVSSRVPEKSAGATGSGSQSASQKSLKIEASSNSSSQKKKEFPTSLSSKLFDRARLSPTKAGSSLGRSLSAKEPDKGKANPIRPRSITGPDAPRLSLADTSVVIDMSNEEDYPPKRKPDVARKSVGGKMARKPPPSNGPVEVIEISSDSDEDPPPKVSPPSKASKPPSSTTKASVQKVALAPTPSTQKKALTSQSASETDKMDVDAPSANPASRPQPSVSQAKSHEKTFSKRISSQSLVVDRVEVARPLPQSANTQSSRLDASQTVKPSVQPTSSKRQRSLSGIGSKYKPSLSQDMQVDSGKTTQSVSAPLPQASKPSESVKPISSSNEARQSGVSTSKPPAPSTSKHVRALSGSKVDEHATRTPSSSTTHSTSSTPIRPQGSKPTHRSASSIIPKTHTPSSNTRPISKQSSKRDSSPDSSTIVVRKPSSSNRPQVAIKSAGGIKPKWSLSPSSSDSGDKSDSEPSTSHRSLVASFDDGQKTNKRSSHHSPGLAGPSQVTRTPERSASVKKQHISPKLSKVTTKESQQSPTTLPTLEQRAARKSQAAVSSGSGSKPSAGTFKYRGDTIDYAIDLTSDNDDDDLLLSQSVAAASKKLVENLSKLKGKGRAVPISPVSPKRYSQTPRSGTAELRLKPSEDEPSPPPGSSSPPLVSPVTPASDFPQPTETKSRRNIETKRHSAPVMLKTDSGSSHPINAQAPQTISRSDVSSKAASPVRSHTKSVSAELKSHPSIHTVLSTTTLDVQSPSATASWIAPTSPRTKPTSANETRAKSSPAAPHISSASSKLPDSSTLSLTTASIANPTQMLKSTAHDIPDKDEEELSGVSTDVEMQDPHTSEDDAMQEIEVALMEDDRDPSFTFSSEPELEPESQKHPSTAWTEPASAAEDVGSSNEAKLNETSSTSLTTAIRRMSRRSSHSSAPPDDDLAKHNSGPASRNTTPEDATAPVPFSGKTLGGFPAITWKDYRRNLDNFTPKCLYSADLPHSLQDQINHMSVRMQNMPAIRDVFQAMILENTIENEPLAPPIEVINDLNDQPTPPWEFHYTNEMWHGQGVPPPDMKNLVSCSCKGVCNPKSKTCTCLMNQKAQTRDEILEFAYDKSGRLKSPGYPVFECNDLCGCSDKCRNRVVQHGRQVQIAIKKTQHKGWGIFAGSKKIPSGTFIGIYAGELLTDVEAHQRGTFYNKSGKTYLFDLDFWYLKGGDPNWTSKYTVDAYQAGNFTRFLNHSCNPNCSLQPCYINEGNIEKPLLVFFSDRDIEPYEEICFNYCGTDDTTDDEEDSGNKETNENDDKIYAKCMCGAPNCKGTMFKRS